MAEERISFMVENARIIKSNFEGREEEYNSKGERNFLLALDEDTAIKMLEDGWNVKYLKPREDDDEGPVPFIAIKVRFDKFPPRIYLITSNSRTRLDESTVEALDWVDIDTVDLIARGSWYDVNGKSGYTAYLKSLFVIIKEDALEQKYQINEPISEERD